MRSGSDPIRFRVTRSPRLGLLSSLNARSKTAESVLSFSSHVATRAANSLTSASSFVMAGAERRTLISCRERTGKPCSPVPSTKCERPSASCRSTITPCNVPKERLSSPDPLAPLFRANCIACEERSFPNVPRVRSLGMGPLRVLGPKAGPWCRRGHGCAVRETKSERRLLGPLARP